LCKLRSGHIGLNQYLARIRAVDSPLCNVCHIPKSVAHFMLTCRHFITARHDLCQAIKGPLTLRSTLGDPKARAAALSYVDATSQFATYQATTETR
ncbi:hypothetical protein C8Q80DRAFT_1098392, partial [Daedaleopsis nitida]